MEMNYKLWFILDVLYSATLIYSMHKLENLPKVEAQFLYKRT